MHRGEFSLHSFGSFSPEEDGLKEGVLHVSHSPDPQFRTGSSLFVRVTRLRYEEVSGT